MLTGALMLALLFCSVTGSAAWFFVFLFLVGVALTAREAIEREVRK